MRVILLTVFLSLVLAAIFVVLFLGERRQRGVRGTEQDALMPLTDEDPPEVVSRRKQNSRCSKDCFSNVISD